MDQAEVSLIFADGSMQAYSGAILSKMKSIAMAMEFIKDDSDESIPIPGTITKALFDQAYEMLEVDREQSILLIDNLPADIMLELMKVVNYLNSEDLLKLINQRFVNKYTKDKDYAEIAEVLNINLNMIDFSEESLNQTKTKYADVFDAAKRRVNEDREKEQQISNTTTNIETSTNADNGPMLEVD